MQPRSILIVCVGNICRSPMAMGFFLKSNLNVELNSAGIHAVVGHAADVKAQQAMLDLYDINIERHIAQQLNVQLIQQADLVLVMSHNQVHHIGKLWPTAVGKIFRLGHWQSVDIMDPYGHSQTEFKQCCQLIHRCVDDWIGQFN